jgi:hypothetical protein
MKQWTRGAWALVVLAAAGAAAQAGVLAGEDDLAIVKKAVASPAPRRDARPAATAPAASPRAAAAAQAAPAPEAAPRPRTGAEPKWFKVRVVERGTGRKKVTVNLPLGLVRALGDEPLEWGCREAEIPRCRTVRLSEILRSLESGQELVEVEDEEATVRVWVE